MYFFQRQRHADDPRRRREYLVRANLNLFGHADANAVGSFQSLLPSGAVGIAGVHNDRPHQPL